MEKQGFDGKKPNWNAVKTINKPVVLAEGRKIVCEVRRRQWQMFFSLDFRYYFFAATGLTCFIVLCKILLPWKFMDKSISWSPAKTVKQRQPKLLDTNANPLAQD